MKNFSKAMLFAMFMLGACSTVEEDKYQFASTGDDIFDKTIEMVIKEADIETTGATLYFREDDIWRTFKSSYVVFIKGDKYAYMYMYYETDTLEFSYVEVRYTHATLMETPDIKWNSAGFDDGLFHSFELIAYKYYDSSTGELKDKDIMSKMKYHYYKIEGTELHWSKATYYEQYNEPYGFAITQVYTYTKM